MSDTPKASDESQAPAVHDSPKPETGPKTGEPEVAPTAAAPQLEPPAPAASRKKLYWFLAVALLLIALVGAAAAGFFVYGIATTAFQSPGHDIVVRIERGWTMAQAAQALEREGVVASGRNLLFIAKVQRLLDQWQGREALTLRAGEFQMSTGWSPLRVLEALRSGKELLHRLTVPEGLPWWEVARLTEAAGLGSQSSFEAAMRDAGLLSRYGIPAPSAEGYLLPQTYLLPTPKDASAQPVVEAMLTQFFKAARDIWPAGLPEPERLHRLVILASIVEKETGVGAERPRVAGVYANRLRLGMLLQADPTVIYGLGQSFDGDLKRRHLEDPVNPYNTYRRPGLPPGPIASPGIASLQAAAFPEEHPYLYFVARGDGSHQFSRTLEEHNRAVQRYQLKR